MIRRGLVAILLLGACTELDCRFDPSPSCSYRAERAAVPDDGGDGALRVTLRTVVAGESHGCAVTTAEEAICWGGNDLSQLSSHIDPAPGVGFRYDLSRRETRLTAGGAHTCAYTERRVFCWGNDAAGQLGDGGDTTLGGVADVELGMEPFVVTAGAAHTCATDGSQVVCWGDNRHGQLGQPDLACCQEPRAVEGLPPLTIYALAAGAFHTCAAVGGLRLDGIDGGVGGVAVVPGSGVYCWGDGMFGARGDGQTEGILTAPVQTDLPDGTVALAMAAGPHQTCAILSSGGVHCWGRGRNGELGDGLGEDSAVPVAAEVSFPVHTVVAGGSNSLSIAEDGSLMIGEGAGRTCVIDNDQRVICWGDNANGELARAEPPVLWQPQRIASRQRFYELALGGRHSCGITEQSELRCWGANDRGQLGRPGEGSIDPMATTVFGRDGASLGDLAPAE